MITWMRGGAKRNQICRNARRGRERTNGDLSECRWSAMDPLRIPYGHAAGMLWMRHARKWMKYARTMGMCMARCAMGRLRILYGIDVNVGAATVSWMCCAYANHLPIICYGDEYMDPGLRGETKFAGIRVADANVPLGICNPNATGPLWIRCRSPAAMP